MQAECWAAKVTACSNWATTSTAAWPAKAAIAAKRSAETAAASASQPCTGSRFTHSPWKANQATSTATPTDQSRPIAPLP